MATKSFKKRSLVKRNRFSPNQNSNSLYFVWLIRIDTVKIGLVAVGGGLLSVRCGLIKLCQNANSSMKSQILNIGLCLTGKLLWDRLGPLFEGHKEALNTVFLPERFSPPLRPERGKASGYRGPTIHQEFHLSVHAPSVSSKNSRVGNMCPAH